MNRLAKRKKKLIFAGLAALIGLMGGMLLLEIGLRIYVASRDWTPNCYVTGVAFFVPHEQAGHTMRPGLRMKSSAYDVTINSLGLRGEEVDVQKPDNGIRVMVIGGSSVFGYLVPDGQDSCCVLEEVMSKDERYRDSKVQVLNAGVPGYNMTQCRLRYESDLSKLNPDVVLMYLGWNDMKFLLQDPDSVDRTPPAPSWWTRTMATSVLYGVLRYRVFPPDSPVFVPPVSSSSNDEDLRTECETQFRNDLQSLVEAVRNAGALPVLSTQLMAAGASDPQLKRYLGDGPEQIEANERLGLWITQVIREEAERSHVPLIDVADKIECDSRYLGDAIHLTQFGHREVAICWAEGLSDALIKMEDGTPEQSGEKTELRREKGSE